MKPTTKVKQRDYLDLLLDEMNKDTITWREVISRLRVLRAQLHNRSANRGRQTAPPTFTMRGKVLHLHRTTAMSMQEISQHLGISIGRCSEIISGKRK